MDMVVLLSEIVRRIISPGVVGRKVSIRLLACTALSLNPQNPEADLANVLGILGVHQINCREGILFRDDSAKCVSNAGTPLEMDLHIRSTITP